MSREIKFSYLWKDADDLFYQWGVTLDDLQGEYFAANLRDMGKGKTLLARRQWTGLSDKNGVEIYEGDIVEAAGHAGPERVEYITCSFKVGGLLGMPLSFWRKEKIKVVGNIYENPELVS